MPNYDVSVMIKFIGILLGKSTKLSINTD